MVCILIFFPPPPPFIIFPPLHRLLYHHLHRTPPPSLPRIRKPSGSHLCPALGPRPFKSYTQLILLWTRQWCPVALVSKWQESTLFRSTLPPQWSWCPFCLLKLDIRHFDCKELVSHCTDNCCSWVVSGEEMQPVGPPLNQFSTSVATSVTVVNETHWLQSITHFALIFPPSCCKSFLSSSKPPEQSDSPPESSWFEPYPSVLPVVPPLGNLFYILNHLYLTSLSILIHHHHDLRLFTFLSTFIFL